MFDLQGFKDTTNLSLLFLAVSDLLSLLTSIWVSICWNPLFHAADLPFLPEDVDYLTGSLPHLLFTRVTGWVTAVVAFERCLATAVPLKVKTLVTPSRLKWTLVSIFVFVAIAQAPSFYTTGLGSVFVPSRNRTLVGLIYRPEKDYIDGVTYSINLVSPFGSFVIVLTCTVITAYKLHEKSKWRATRAQAHAQQKDPTSGKDRKIIKMVVVISVVFIFSYLPTNAIHIFYCSIAGDPGLVVAYWDGMSLAFSFVKLLEAINATVSLGLYLTMSSRFRATFLDIFRPKQLPSRKAQLC